jgi:hypothetical protein
MTTSRLGQIYAHFCEFCMTVGIEKPMAVQRWLAITDRLVKEPYIPEPPASTVPKHCWPRNPARNLCIARVKSDGLIVRQIGTIGREGFYNFKSCRACGRFLLKSRFSKQGKCLRAVCKMCDNSRRMKERKRKPGTLSLQGHEVRG